MPHQSEKVAEFLILQDSQGYWISVGVALHATTWSSNSKVRGSVHILKYKFLEYSIPIS